MNQQANFTDTVINILRTPLSDLARGKIGPRPRIYRRPNALRTKVAESKSSAAAFSMEGELRPGNEGSYMVNGVEFTVDDDTWIFGDLEIGAKAVVHGVDHPERGRYARKIVITQPFTK